MGKVLVIVGPMYSGKTMEMLRRIMLFINQDCNCIAFKWKGDNRNDNIKCHNGFELKVKTISTDLLMNKISEVEGYEVIGIDEGQFFSDIVEFSELMANDYDKTVIISALKSDFKRHAFENIARLYPLADTIIDLKAVCHDCLKPAAFSHRLDTKNKNQISVGDKDEYVSVCRKCYNERNNPNKRWRKRIRKDV
jgi:thymidine kinase